MSTAQMSASASRSVSNLNKGVISSISQGEIANVREEYFTTSSQLSIKAHPIKKIHKAVVDVSAKMAASPEVQKLFFKEIMQQFTEEDAKQMENEIKDSRCFQKLLKQTEEGLDKVKILSEEIENVTDNLGDKNTEAEINTLLNTSKNYSAMESFKKIVGNFVDKLGLRKFFQWTASTAPNVDAKEQSNAADTSVKGAAADPLKDLRKYPHLMALSMNVCSLVLTLSLVRRLIKTESGREAFNRSISAYMAQQAALKRNLEEKMRVV